MTKRAAPALPTAAYRKLALTLFAARTLIVWSTTLHLPLSAPHTERHESRRIDNQLRGRSGRQGDPGSTRFFLSLEDPLFR